MNKFRKWLFKFLTGHDLVEYVKIRDELYDTLKHANKALDCCVKACEETRSVIALTQEVNRQCQDMLELCKEVKANETLG